MTDKKATETPAFEASLSRLDEIVARLEDSKTPLDELLALFEEGVRSVRYCTEALDKAEKRVVSLTKNKETGEIVEVDFPDRAD